MMRVAISVGLLLALSVTLVPSATAQSTTKIPRVAYVVMFNTGPSAPFAQDFRGGMKQLGWEEGKTIRIEEYSANGSSERLSSIMRQLADSKVDIIVAVCTPEAKAAMKVTSTIPIVVAATGDAVKSGLVQSYARPGGNVTGVSGQLLELSAKRIELLKESFPATKNVTALWNPARGDNALEIDAMASIARNLGMQFTSREVRDREELELTLTTTPYGPGQALTDAGDSLLSSPEGLPAIIKFASEKRLPAIYDDRGYVDAGGLMSYGPNLPGQHRLAAQYVDKILKGAKPGELPMQQPTKFELIINLKTAKALGFAIPQSVLLRADEVIQ
jgi:putative tryptophan/tyrosine transport system substrate-binding protein